jgi:hypothetical protein
MLGIEPAMVGTAEAAEGATFDHCDLLMRNVWMRSVYGGLGMKEMARME